MVIGESLFDSSYGPRGLTGQGGTLAMATDKNLLDSSYGPRGLAGLDGVTADTAAAAGRVDGTATTTTGDDFGIPQWLEVEVAPGKWVRRPRQPPPPVGTPLQGTTCSATALPGSASLVCVSNASVIKYVLLQHHFNST